MLNKNEESKAFYKSLFNVVGPIAIQNLISAAVSSADVVMLGFVGQTSIAAVSLASNVMFILMICDICCSESDDFFPG